MDEMLIAFWVFAAGIIAVNLWFGLQGSTTWQIREAEHPAVPISVEEAGEEQIAVGAD
jgi:hypothetical protein